MSETYSLSRTVAMPGATLNGYSLRWPVKDPGDVADYTLDVSAWMQDAGDLPP